MSKEIPPSFIPRMCNSRQNSTRVTIHLNWLETLPLLALKVPHPEETLQAKEDRWPPSPSRGQLVSPLPLGCLFWWKWVRQALALLTHFPFPSISHQEGAVPSSAFLKLGDVMWLTLSNKTWVEKIFVTSGWKHLRTSMCISPYFLPHIMTLAMSQMAETHPESLS